MTIGYHHHNSNEIDENNIFNESANKIILFYITKGTATVKQNKKLWVFFEI